jgi:hypothetical protein
MEATYSERLAQQLGYPLGVCGYSPNERAYWFEPALAWANALLNPEQHGLDPDACARELRGLQALPLVWNENMAPRFATGTFLAGRLVGPDTALAVGDVLLWTALGDAPDCPTLARLVSIELDCLRLSSDNGGHPYVLAWGPGAPALHLYRVTHYISQPVP